MIQLWKLHDFSANETLVRYSLFCVCTIKKENWYEIPTPIKGRLNVDYVIIIIRTIQYL